MLNHNIQNEISKAQTCAQYSDAQGVRSHVANAVRDALVSQCMYKKEIQVRDKLSHRIKTVLVPCGHCYHCQMTKRNEWVARCQIHTAYCSKHCYFVTLTYRPFEKFESIPDFLRSGYWHYDDDNVNKRMMWSPCVLRHDHFQRFMRYLRKYSGQQNISFYMCGEYGETHGRPHLHAIVWSDEPIKRDAFVRAWSYNTGTRKNPVWLPIGRIQIDDLNDNGTISGKSGDDKSAKNCFAYVAKYCSKSAYAFSLGAFSHTRLRYLLEDLKACTYNPTAADCFDRNTISKLAILREYNEYLAEYCRDRQVRVQKQELYEYRFQPKYYFNIKIENYEKDFCNYVNSFAITDDEERGRLHLEFWQTHGELLAFIFRPYLQCSRRNAIGANYFAAHADEFARLQFPRPTFGDADNPQPIVLPSYFYRKTAEYIERYFPTNDSGLADRLSSASFANESDRDDILKNRLCLDSGQDDSALTTLHYVVESALRRRILVEEREIESGDIVGISGQSIISRQSIESLLKSHYCFFDAHTRCRCLIFANPVDFTPDSIEYYRYDRSRKKYLHVASVSVTDWFDNLLECVELLCRYALYKSDLSLKSDMQYRWLFRTCDVLCQNNGANFSSMMQVISDAESEKREIAKRELLNRKNFFKHEKSII